MYIKNIKIKNYRNYNDFSMDFNDGLNVIVGSNNSGKTGLLCAIDLLNNLDKISINDFNKNNLVNNYNTVYKESPPEIIIEYLVLHDISEENTDDESIIKLISFLGMDKIKESKEASLNPSIYTLSACIKMQYALSSKQLGRYVNAVSSATSFEEYYKTFELFQKDYVWTFSNGVSETNIDKKEVLNIFKVDFIKAERKSEAVYRETRREIHDFLNSTENIEAVQKMQQEISTTMKQNISPVLDKIDQVIFDEGNAIGLKKGNVSIAQDIRHTAAISDSYVIDVKDTNSDFVLPLSHNGLGYNNLINMYMLIRLVEIQKGKDFRILCLEEPEAHLHPAMQYKLFKFLKKIDDENNLNQQIFVTTHSPNITAVAGIDNMYMISYERDGTNAECKQQSLEMQFKEKAKAKKHMVKFLDVTRSDMMFADKIIFVEGIAEKLLLPKFMDKCCYSYEDEHVAIVEIGGKHFYHFIEMFADSNVYKKVLCITDKDFKWIDNKKLVDVNTYCGFIPNHIRKLNEDYNHISNLNICSQTNYGKTFEDELFLNNFSNEEVAISLLKLALSDTLQSYIDENGVNFIKWCVNKDHIDGRSSKKIKKLLEYYKKACLEYPANFKIYKKLFFAKLFLSYAKSKKGEVALNILVDDNLMKKIETPAYIEDGIQWLSE